MSKNILVVDDMQELREVLAINFELEGVNVFQASNGLEALEIIRAEKIDLVLTDVKMPKLDGIALLKEIKKSNPDIPVVVIMTGEAPISRDEIIKLGGADLIMKPYIDTEYVMSLLK